MPTSVTKKTMIQIASVFAILKERPSTRGTLDETEETTPRSCFPRELRTGVAPFFLGEGLREGFLAALVGVLFDGRCTEDDARAAAIFLLHTSLILSKGSVTEQTSAV